MENISSPKQDPKHWTKENMDEAKPYPIEKKELIEGKEKKTSNPPPTGTARPPVPGGSKPKILFPFEQKNETRDCGYRCCYYAVNPGMSYPEWLEYFRFFNPVKSGILFSDICNILSYYKKDYKFTQLSDTGLFIIYSGIWLHVENKKHGHYFVYHDGYVYCSTHKEKYKMELKEVIKRLESKSVDLSYRCLEIL